MAGLMEWIVESVKGRVAAAKLDLLDDEIRKRILREFVRTGKAPDSSEIMAGMGLVSEEMVKRTVKKLEGADILITCGGRIVSAYPFSSVETRHRVIFRDGHEVYALCATDAMGIHFMLNEDITILSKCPCCEGEMEVIIRNGRIESRNPPGIVEFVGEGKQCGCTAETCCPYMNFFCSLEHLAKWKKKNRQLAKGDTYSPDEALQHGRMIFEDFLR